MDVGNPFKNTWTSEAGSGKSSDKEMAKIQTFVLDAVAPSDSYVGGRGNPREEEILMGGAEEDS